MIPWLVPWLLAALDVRLAQPSVMTIAVINVILTFALPIYEGRQDEAQNMARPGL